MKPFTKQNKENKSNNKEREKNLEFSFVFDGHILDHTHITKNCSLCDPEFTLNSMKESQVNEAFMEWLEHHKKTSSWIPNEVGQILLFNFFDSFSDVYKKIEISNKVLKQEEEDIGYTIIYNEYPPYLGTMGMECLFGLNLSLKLSVLDSESQLRMTASLFIKNLDYLLALTSNENIDITLWYEPLIHLKGLYEIIYLFESIANDSIDSLISTFITFNNTSNYLKKYDMAVMHDNLKILKEDYIIKISASLVAFISRLIDPGRKWFKFLDNWKRSPTQPTYITKSPSSQTKILSEAEKLDIIFISLVEILLKFQQGLNLERPSKMSPYKYVLLEHSIHSIGSLVISNLVSVDLLLSIGMIDILASFIGWPPFVSEQPDSLYGTDFTMEFESYLLRSEFTIQVLSWRFIDLANLGKNKQLERYLTGSNLTELFCWVFYFSQTVERKSLFQSNKSSYSLINNSTVNSWSSIDNDFVRMSLYDELNVEIPGVIKVSTFEESLHEFIDRKENALNLVGDSLTLATFEYKPPYYFHHPWSDSIELEILFSILLTICLKDSLIYERYLSLPYKAKDVENSNLMPLSNYELTEFLISELQSYKIPFMWVKAINLILAIFDSFAQNSISLSRGPSNTSYQTNDPIETMDDLHINDILFMYVKQALARKPSISKKTHPPLLQIHFLNFVTHLLFPIYDPIPSVVGDFPENKTNIPRKWITYLHRLWCQKIFEDTKLLSVLCSECFFGWGTKALEKKSQHQGLEITRYLQQAIIDFLVYSGTLPDSDYNSIYSTLLKLLDVATHYKDSRGVYTVARGLYRVFKYNKSVFQHPLKNQRFFDSLVPALQFCRTSGGIDIHDSSNPVTTLGLDPSAISAFWMLLSVIDFGLIRHQELSLLVFKNNTVIQLLFDFLDSQVIELVEFAASHISVAISNGLNEKSQPSGRATPLSKGLRTNMALTTTTSQPLTKLINQYLYRLNNPLDTQIHFKMSFLILEGISNSILRYPPHSKERKVVQNSLVDSKCFDQLYMALEQLSNCISIELIPLKATYVSSIIKSFTALLSQNDHYRMELAKSDGYARFCIAILENDNVLTQETFDSLFGMLVDSSTWQQSSNRIFNKYTIAVLMDLFSIMEPDLQMQLMDRMISLAKASDINKWSLCNSSIVSKILNSPIPPSVSSDYVAKTMVLFEILGSFSVTISDVKLLLSCLCFDKHSLDGANSIDSSFTSNGSDIAISSTKYLASQLTSLLEMLYNIAQRNNDLSFFQFRIKGSGIQIQNLSALPPNGYSFFTWLRLEEPSKAYFRSITETSQLPNCTNNKQTLYSFSDGTGNSFEAYFQNNSLYFQLDQSSGRSKLLSTRSKLSMGRWYFVAIAHTNPKFKWGFGQPELTYYLDGELVLQSPLDYPTFEQSKLYSFVGASASEGVSKLAYGAKISSDLLENSFNGQMTTLYLLSTAITQSQVHSIYELGKHHSSIFTNDLTKGVQTASTLTCANLIEPSLSVHLTFALHIGASKGNTCFNLASYQTSPETLFEEESHIHASLVRIEKCSTISLQNAIHALGGLEVFFPLLLKFDTIANTPSLRGPLDTYSEFFIQKGPAHVFFTLMGALLKNHEANQRSMLDNNNIRIIALLLAQVHPKYLTISAYQSIVALVSCISPNSPLITRVYYNLLFNMRIWVYSDYETQAYILNSIKSIVESRKAYFRNDFGIQYFLDMLRICYYYEPGPYSMSDDHCNFDVERPKEHHQIYQLRSFLLDIVASYLRKDILLKEVYALSRHLLSNNDYKHTAELLSLLLQIMKEDVEATYLKLFLKSKGFEILCALLQKTSNDIRALVFATLTFFVQHPKIPEKWKLRMQEGNIFLSICSKVYTKLPLNRGAYLAILGFTLDVTTEDFKSLGNFGTLHDFKLKDNSLPKVRNPGMLLILLNFIKNPATSESLKIAVLNDINFICINNLDVCHRLQNSNGFISTLTELLPVYNYETFTTHVLSEKDAISSENDEKGSSLSLSLMPKLPQSIQLVIELISTIAINTLGSDIRYNQGLKFISEMVYYWWSSSSINCRREGNTLQRDALKVNILSTENDDLKHHNSTLNLIRYFLCQVCARLEKVMAQKHGSIKPDSNYEKWTENILNFTRLVNVLLFHCWELESEVFSRLQFTNIDFNNVPTSPTTAESINDLPDQLKRLSDPNLALLQALNPEQMVHQTPNNPWEESLELAISFLNFVDRFDQFIAELKLNTNGDRRSSFFDTIYASKYNPCYIYLYILISGFEVVDPNVLNLVKSHCKLFFERHHLHTNVTKGVAAEHNCPFTANILQYIVPTFGYAQTNLSLKGNTDSKRQSQLLLYKILLKSCWSYLSEVSPSSKFSEIDLLQLLEEGNDSKIQEFLLSPIWTDFYDEFLFTAMKNDLEEGFNDFSLQADSVLQGLNSLIKKVRKEVLDSNLSFERVKTIIDGATSSYYSEEQHRIATLEVERKTILNRTTRFWLVKLQEMTREHSGWLPSSSSNQIHWKLDLTENYSRMRRRLAINHEFDPHLEASAKRDKTPVKNSEEKLSWKRNSVTNYLKKASSRSRRIQERLSQFDESKSEIDSLLSTDSNDDPEWNLVNHEDVYITGPTENVKEKVLCEMDCTIIFLLATIHGKLRLTPSQLTFTIDRQRLLEELSLPHSTVTIDWEMIHDRRWLLSEVREIHFRKHLLRNSALEIFFTDQSTTFLSFNSAQDRDFIHQHLANLTLTNLIGSYVGAPSEILKKSNLTQRWQKHEISNFEYLMQLNAIAGRTYNDLTQYFVFPWILNDYTSPTLDLDDPNVYRDLRKPVGALNSQRLNQFLKRYHEFEDPDGKATKFLYGTHYSSAASVCYYLLRMEPFTSIHIALQSGKFDHADRQFSSIASCWNSCLNNLADVKELIPEFFYLPEFFKNSNRFDLGTTQKGQLVDDVQLPPWASSPEQFVQIHREALESELVSQNLHHWVDLIFGYKQIGPEAHKANNIFYYLTYEGAVDLESIEDPHERKSIQEQIYHFGQTPTQLLTTPHPRRHPNSRVGIPTRLSSESYRWKVNASGYKTYLLKLPASNFTYINLVKQGPSVTSPTAARSMDSPSNNRFIVTVDCTGKLGTHRLLTNVPSVEDSDIVPFTLEVNGKTNTKVIPSPFANNAKVTPRSFALTADGQYLISTGHWDHCFKQIHLTTGKVVASVPGHGDLVTCCALSADGKILVTGSKSTNVMAWSLTSSVYPNLTRNAVPAYKRKHSRARSTSLDSNTRKPSFTLTHQEPNITVHRPADVAFYGHDDTVTCLDLDLEHDLLVTGSKDGTCIVHSLRTGSYLRSIQPHHTRSRSRANVIYVMVGKDADLIIVTHFRNRQFLTTYTCNGTLLNQSELEGYVNDIQLSKCKQYLYLVDTEAKLKVVGVRRLEPVLTMDIPLVANCIHFDLELNCFLLGCDEGKLLVIDSNVN